jgi:response regulator RpfG family c-di-GMP phosphodiesterase
MTVEGSGPARVLFVDDEENVLLALGRQVRGLVAAEMCTQPRAAAALLASAAEQDGYGFAAVVTDMRMPEMDGVALLEHATAVSPFTTRVLLTGYADVESAIGAVNQGGIFRFLTKPFPTAQLRAVLTSAIDQHQLLRDRRELLEHTLRGAVEALVEALAMAHPAAFARAIRLRALTARTARLLGMAESWQVEVAAQLGEIGVITLPPVALAVLTRGVPAEPAVAEMLAELPAIADGILRRIPRLEPVREIVRGQQPVEHPDAQALARAQRPVRLVQAVREYDALICRGEDSGTAIGLLRARGHHDGAVLDALARVVVVAERAGVGEVEVGGLRPGMVLAADLRSSTGALLVGRGQPVTAELVKRIRNFEAVSGLQGRPVVRESPP